LDILTFFIFLHHINPNDLTNIIWKRVFLT
jgi:hypothetical protein